MTNRISLFDSDRDGIIDAGIDNDSTATEDLSISNLTGLELTDAVSKTADRGLNTTYQNTSDVAIYVNVRMENDTGSYDTIDCGLAVSKTETGTDSAMNETAYHKEGVPVATKHSLTATVPPGYYYRLRSFRAETIEFWAEREYRSE